MKTPLRIAFLDHTAQLGGAEHLLLRLLTVLPAERIQPLLICAEEGPLVNKARRMGIQTERLTGNQLRSISRIQRGRKVVDPVAIFTNVITILRLVVKLVHLLRDENIDVIQTNSSFAHVIGGLAARWMHIPSIWHLHDLIETKRGHGAFAAVWRSLAWLLADHVVGDSRAVIERIGPHAAAVAIYPACFQDTVPALFDVGLPSDAKIVGFFGRIAYVKGLDILAHAARQVIGSDRRVHFLLVGSGGDDELEARRQIDHIIHRSDLLANWHWLGYQDHASALMRSVDVVVLPSRREAFGMVLLEAGLAGKPVVASRVGGITETVLDGETGLLVPPEDADALARALISLLSQPVRATEMGRRGREHILQDFPPERFRDEFLALYDTVCC